MDGAGNVFVAWLQETLKVGSLSTFSLFASRLNAQSGLWSDAALVEADETATVSSGAGIAMAPDGTALALWTQAKRIMFNRFK